MKKNVLSILSLALGLAFLTSCSDDDSPLPGLELPTDYISASFDTNVTAERTVRTELGDVTEDLNDAEAAAASGGNLSKEEVSEVSAIEYPENLSAVTLPAYRTLVEDWLVEVVKAANSPDGFQNPDDLKAAREGDQGGLLGTRLLDETGLELEQMVEKGSFGAALYNHALTVLDGELTSASVDKLVEIFGTDISFDIDKVDFAANYAKRRSDHEAKTGFFYDIKTNLITAKAAIEAGSEFETERDEALDAFLLNWEKSNFATVIFYCNAAKGQFQNADSDEDRGNAMHAYAEGVAFAAGFKGLANKQITDAQIDDILELLLAPIYDSEGTIESYKFINDPMLVDNLDEIVEDIQEIYDFTDAEVISFYENN